MAPCLPDTFDEKLFGLYLSDHLTGATAGLARIDRMSNDFTDTPVHAGLARIGSEIRGERTLLRALIHDLGLRQRPHRQAASWLLERVGRLKLNGRVFNRSPLTLVLEAELMRSAVMGKLGLWQTLEDTAAEIGLDPARFADLARQVQDQLAALDRVHEYARATGFRTQNSARPYLAGASVLPAPRVPNTGCCFKWCYVSGPPPAPEGRPVSSGSATI